MHELDLDLLNADLTRISNELSAKRQFEDLAPGMRRILWRPRWRAAWALMVGSAALAVGWAYSSSVLMVLGGVLVTAIFPGHVRTAIRRSRAAGSMDLNLFVEHATSARNRVGLEVSYLFLAIPLVAALVILALGLPGQSWLYWLAGGVALSLPYRLFFRLPASLREQDQADRWAAGEKDAVEEEDDEDDEDEDGDGPFWRPIGELFMAIFFVILCPLGTLYLAATAVMSSDPLRPALAAGFLVLAAFWWRRRIRSLVRRWDRS